jgi:hypothetical protein
MGVTPGTRPTGPALKAASVAGGPEVAAAANAEQQRRQIDKIKAKRPKRPPGSGSTPATPPEQIPTTEELQQRQANPPPASPGGGFSVPAVPAAAQTGSGFLLGVLVWAGALAYLRGGLPEVRRLAAAKFLNRTTTGG